MVEVVSTVLFCSSILIVQQKSILKKALKVKYGTEGFKERDFY